MAIEDAHLAIKNALLHVNEAEQVAVQDGIANLTVQERLLFSIAYSTVATAVAQVEESFLDAGDEEDGVVEPVFTEEELKIVKRFLESVPKEAIDSVFVD